MQIWMSITRLGEVQLLLPIAAWASLRLLLRGSTRTLVAWWWLGIVLAVGITVGSKIAFIGWGLGSAAFNFTGFSGHSMMSAVVLPLAAAVLLPVSSHSGRLAALLGGVLIAVLVAVSRVMVNAHSVSEVVSGCALGLAAAWPVACRLLPIELSRPRILAPGLVAVWLLAAPVHVPTVQSHTYISQLALRLSGRSSPFTRAELLRGQHAVKTPAATSGPSDAAGPTTPP